jgi:hypothetical protein
MPVGFKTVLSARTPVQSRQGGSGTGALLAVCLGFFVIQLDAHTSAASTGLPLLPMSLASGVLNAARQSGGALGVALLAALFAAAGQHATWRAPMSAAAAGYAARSGWTGLRPAVRGRTGPCRRQMRGLRRSSGRASGQWWAGTPAACGFGGMLWTDR